MEKWDEVAFGNITLVLKPGSQYKNILQYIDFYENVTVGIWTVGISPFGIFQIIEIHFLRKK